MNEKDYARFIAKVKKSDGCWVWTGSTRNGYGQLGICVGRGQNGKPKYRTAKAHRLMYEHHHGQIPKGPGYHGYCVLHKCDNPACVRPDHLFLGTNLDNVRDRDAKGRRVNPRGERHGRAILKPDQVLEIYRMATLRTPQAQIAAKFGVCISTVSYIKAGRLWAHLTRPFHGEQA